MSLTQDTLYELADRLQSLGETLGELEPGRPVDSATGTMLAKALSIAFDQLGGLVGPPEGWPPRERPVGGGLQ